MPAPPGAFKEIRHHKAKVYQVPKKAGDPDGISRYVFQGSLKAVHVPSSVKDWQDGKEITWQDPDINWSEDVNDFREGNAYYRIRVKKNKIEYTYTSRTEGNPFVTVELTHVGGLPYSNPPTPQRNGNVLLWEDVTPGLDIYLVCTPDRVELRKRIKNSSADRELKWQVKESDPLPLRRQQVSLGHDNADLSEPSRDGTGPGRRQRQVELDHTITPIGGAPAGENWYTIDEVWTGKTWKLNANRVKSLNNSVVYPVDIDVLVEEEIAADGDDGYGRATTNDWNASYASTNNNVPYDAPGGDHYWPGFRFTTVAIPKGATIDSADFAVERVSGTGTLNGTLDVSAEDNAAAWSNSNRPETKTAIGSGVSVTWTGTASTDVTANLAVDIQSLVNRSGWASNNALAIFDTSFSGGTGYYEYLEDEADADAGAARLDINYTVSGTDVNATTNTLSLTAYSATVNAETSIQANADTFTLTTYQATVNAETSIQANVDTYTITSYQATVNAETSIQANVDTYTITAYAATVNAETSIQANVDTYTLTTYQSDVNLDKNVTANVDTYTLTTYQATVNLITNILANVDTYTLTEYAATVNAETSIQANADTYTLTTYQATVNIGINIDTNVDTYTLTTYPATVNAETSIQANVDTYTLTTYPATVNAETNVQANVDTFTLATYQANVDLDRNVLANVDTYTLTTYPATVNAETNIQANVDTYTLTTYQSDVDLDKNVQANVDTYTLTTYQATVNAETSIQANVDTYTLTTYQSDVNLDKNVTTNVDTYTLTTYPATVNAETSIQANVDTYTLTEYPATVDASNPTIVLANVVNLTLTEYPANVNAETSIQANVDTYTLTTYSAAVERTTNINASLATLSLNTLSSTVALRVRLRQPVYTRLIDKEGSYTYVGESTPGSSNTAATWRIKRVEDAGGGDFNILWANAQAGFVHVWNDRVVKSYS